MNKFNRGMTIIEILISVGIIGMVLLFLFNMLVQVRQEDEQNNAQSNFIINQSSFIRIVSEDIANYGLVGVSECGDDFAKVVDKTTLDVSNNNLSNYMCIRFEYGKGYIKDRIGYLMVYKYYTDYSSGKGEDPKWMMKYSRGYYRSCGANGKYSYWQETARLGKEMPAEITFGNGVQIKYTAMDSALNASTITMPILDEAGNHYDIVLSFLFQGNNSFYCQSSAENKHAYTNECKCLNGNCSKITERSFSYTCDY